MANKCRECGTIWHGEHPRDPANWCGHPLGSQYCPHRPRHVLVAGMNEPCCCDCGIARTIDGPTYEPEVACAMIEAGKTVYFNPHDLARWLGFKRANDLLPLINTGELTATGWPDGNGNWNDVAISSDAVLAYLGRHPEVVAMVKRRLAASEGKSDADP